MLRIKEYTSPISGETAMLVDSSGMPLAFANRYVYSTIEKSGGSLSSIRHALFVISRIYLWAKSQRIDLEQRLFYGGYLTAAHAADLTDFIQFTSSTQHEILRHNQKEQAKNYFDRSKVLSFKVTTDIKYKYTSNLLYANRLRILRKFLKWVIIERKAQRIPTSQIIEERSKLASVIIESSIPRVRARNENEHLESVDLDVIHRIAVVLHPEHPDNPFSTDFLRHRNFLLLLLLIETGGRRKEIYQATSKDIIVSTKQYDIKISKTTPRTLPVSSKLIESFEAYYEKYWKRITDGKSGYLFVKSNGQRLSLRAMNSVIETVRKNIPEVPYWFHTHTIRRAFNHRLSLLIDQKREAGFVLSEEQERKMRNRLNGWSINSTMGALYNARHIREKADKLAERALTEIWQQEEIK